MDIPELLGSAGVATALGAAGTLVGRWLTVRAQRRKAELDHDGLVSPALLERIDLLEAREGRYEASLADVRAQTEECERRHRERDVLDRKRDAAEAECKRDLALLRAEVREIARAARGQRSTPPQPMVAASGRTVLVVDDEDDVRRSIAALLTASGHRVLTAADATDALATLATEERIDVALVDWRMSGGATGASLIEAIRRSRKRVALAVITGAPESVPSDLGLPVIRKPADREQLDRLIARVLDDTGRWQVQT